MYCSLSVPQLITLAPTPVVEGVVWEEAAAELPSSETQKWAHCGKYQYVLWWCTFCFPDKQNFYDDCYRHYSSEGPKQIIKKINVRRFWCPRPSYFKPKKTGVGNSSQKILEQHEH